MASKFTKDGEPLTWLRDMMSNPPEGCVKWPFAMLSSGYGSLQYEGKTQSASRVVMKLKGEEGIARHKCRDKACVNPNHIEGGSASQNSAEDRLRDGTLRRTITPQAQYYIENLLENISQIEIAKFVGCHQGTVSRIKLQVPVYT